MTDSNTQERQLPEVENIWSAALTSIPSDADAQALGLRGNVRIDVLQAFKAVFYTTKAYINGKIVLTTGSITPYELSKLVTGGVHAVIATIRTFYESLSEAEYVTCVVVSYADATGVRESNLQKQVLSFVDSVDHKKLPFYLCLGDSVVANAKRVFEDSDAMMRVVNGLVDRNLLERNGDTLHFTSKHFEWVFNKT